MYFIDQNLFKKDFKVSLLNLNPGILQADFDEGSNVGD
jgi:hypothetical protein